MSSTNKTTNYNLSQFIGTDVPSYLGDYNSDMNKIDKAIGDVANSQGSVEQSVVGLTAEVQGLSTQVSGTSTSVQQLQTSVAQIDSGYKQADTALSQRITANANNIQTNTTAIESANTAIGNINTAIGTADISGIGDGTIKGAISNINSNLGNDINIRYNPETDKVEIFYNGQWNPWKTAGLQTHYVYNLGEFVMDMSNGVYATQSDYTAVSLDNTENGLYFGTSLDVGKCKTVITNELIDLSGYSTLLVEYSNNGVTNQKTIDISSIQNGYIAAYFTRSGGTYYGDVCITSTKENFISNVTASVNHILPDTTTFPSNFYIRKIWLE